MQPQCPHPPPCCTYILPLLVAPPAAARGRDPCQWTMDPQQFRSARFRCSGQRPVTRRATLEPCGRTPQHTADSPVNPHTITLASHRARSVPGHMAKSEHIPASPPLAERCALGRAQQSSTQRGNGASLPTRHAASGRPQHPPTPLLHQQLQRLRPSAPARWPASLACTAASAPRHRRRRRR